MIPPVEKMIDVGEHHVQVDSSGSGPDIVILHSLLTGPEAFDQVAASLSAERTVHRMYLPGFGASTPIRDRQTTMAGLADVVAATMEELGCEPETTVLGNGLGSFVALTLAIRHGTRFANLIASNTGAKFSEERTGAFQIMSELAANDGMEAVADIAVKRIFPTAYLKRHPEALTHRRAVLTEMDAGAFAAACRALAVLDLTDQLAAIENPTMVVAGEIDETTPPEMGRAVADLIPGAGFVEIEGCGHCPQLEQPHALLAAINGFLSSPQR